MATYTSNQVMQTNSTTTMRPHVAFMEQLLTAAGWVQTADTGQTASGSFPAATGTNTVAGYQIWRMNDSLQATAPVFVKIEFGSGAATNTLGLWFTIGTGSNGTGSITGTLGSRFNVPQQTTSATSLPAYGSGSTDRACAIHGYQTVTANCTLMWGIDRSRDSAGAATAEGVTFNAVWGSSTLSAHQYLPFTGATRAAQNAPTCPVPTSGLTSLLDVADVGFIPLLPFGQTGPREPGLNFLVYSSADVAANLTPTVTVRGGSHVYRTIGTPFNWSTAVPTWSGSCWAIRYE